MFDKSKKKLVSGMRKISMQQLTYYNDTVFDNCGEVILFSQVKCAYNKIRKAANSSTIMFIVDALAASEYTHGTVADEKDYHRRKHESISRGISLSKIWRPAVLDKLPDYFWFTVVRNPYTRLLSAFLQKGLGSQGGARQLKCAAPHLKGKFIPGFDRLDPTGFKEFVFFLKNGGLYDDKHWWPQNDLLFMPPERFDYIAKTETLEKDLRHVFQQVGLHNIQHLSFSKPHVAEKSSGWKVTNANSHVMEFYDSDIRSIVYDLYKPDFINFGYDYGEF